MVEDLYIVQQKDFLKRLENRGREHRESNDGQAEAMMKLKKARKVEEEKEKQAALRRIGINLFQFL